MYIKINVMTCYFIVLRFIVTDIIELLNLIFNLKIFQKYIKNKIISSIDQYFILIVEIPSSFNCIY